jgi:hypothetical protein
MIDVVCDGLDVSLVRVYRQEPWIKVDLNCKVAHEA